MISGTANPIRVWMLAVLLVLFQTGTLAHSHDDPVEAADLCEICVHAQQSDDALPIDYRFVHAVTANAVSLRPYQYRAVFSALATNAPRAPPLSL